MPAAVSVFDGVTGAGLAVALDRALDALGWGHRPAPADGYALGVAQGESEPAAEGMIWWEDGGAVVLERHPGADAGFGFHLTRAVSAVTGELGLAVDALRGRSRYGLIAAYAGRPVELAVCDGDGVTEAGRPTREGAALCDEDRVWARFTDWVGALADGAGGRLRSADGPPLAAWLATPDGGRPAAAEPTSAPLARAWFAGVSPDEFAAALGDVGHGWRWTAGQVIVLERESTLDRALVEGVAARLDAAMLAVGLGADSGPFTWVRHVPGGASQDGAGLGAADLIAMLADWRSTALRSSARPRGG